MGRGVGGVAASHEEGVQRIKGRVPALKAATIIEEGAAFCKRVLRIFMSEKHAGRIVIKLLSWGYEMADYI